MQSVRFFAKKINVISAPIIVVLTITPFLEYIYTDQYIEGEGFSKESQ